MYIWDFSRSVGAGRATTRNTRGLTRSVIAFIVPPFPAPSRPSNTMQTFSPVCLVHSCSVTSLTCSLPKLALVVLALQLFARSCVLLDFTALAHCCAPLDIKVGRRWLVRRIDHHVAHAIAGIPGRSAASKSGRNRAGRNSRTRASKVATDADCGGADRVIIWHLLMKNESYAWARPALHAKKLRDVELRAGHRPARGQKARLMPTISRAIATRSGAA